MKLEWLTVAGSGGHRFRVLFAGVKNGVAQLPNEGGAMFLCSDLKTGRCTSLHGPVVQLVPRALRRLRKLCAPSA